MLNGEQVESRLIFHRYVSSIKFFSVYLLVWTTVLDHSKFMESKYTGNDFSSWWKMYLPL